MKKAPLLRGFLFIQMVAAATHGFCDGFLTTFKPANMMAVGAPVEVDQGAYKYLATKYLKK